MPGSGPGYSVSHSTIYFTPGDLRSTQVEVFTPASPEDFRRCVKGNRTVYLPSSGPGFYLGVSDGLVWVNWVGTRGPRRTPFDLTFTQVLKSLS